MGFGAAAIGNLYRAVSDPVAEEAIERAIEAGLVWFDTAPRYGFGLSETRLGTVLTRHPRQCFRLSSKVGRTLEHDPEVDVTAVRQGFVSPMRYREAFDYSYDAVLRSVDESLVRLKVDHLDLVHVHDLGVATHGQAHRDMTRAALAGAFPALVRLKDEGVVGGIGLGVNEVQVCLDLLGEAPLDALLLAGRYTLLDAQAGEELLPRCREMGIGVFLGGVFNSGILAAGSKTASHFDYAPADESVRDRVRRLETVCDRYAVPLPAAAIAFACEGEGVGTVLLGLGTPAEVDAAITMATHPIPAALWRDLRAEGLIPADRETVQ